MFPPKAFDALVKLIAKAAARRVVDGEPEEVFEPLDRVEPGLPRARCFTRPACSSRDGGQSPKESTAGSSGQGL